MDFLPTNHVVIEQIVAIKDTSDSFVHYVNDTSVTEKILATASILHSEEFLLSSAERKKQLADGATQEALSFTVEYPFENELSNTIANFAAKTLQTSNLPKVKPLSNKDPLSGDSVYFIYTEGKKNLPAIVVKTFKSSEENFLREIDGINIHKEQGLKYSHSVNVLNIATTQMKETTLFMVAFSVAPGETLSKFPGSPDEKNPIPAFTRLGEGLGELHTKNISSITKNDFIAELEEKKKTALENLEFYLENGKDDDLKEAFAKIGVKRLVTYFEDVTIDLPENIPMGYVHGDAHFGNFLYDTSTNIFSMIDLGTTKQGFPSKDYYNIIEHIDRLKDESEKNRLKEAFSNGYAHAGGDVPSSELMKGISLKNQLEVFAAHKWIDYYGDGQAMCKAILHRNIANLLKNLRP